jgi:hypothetical protein
MLYSHDLPVKMYWIFLFRRLKLVNRSESIVASIWYPQETPSLCGGTQATGGGIVLISSKEVAHVPLLIIRLVGTFIYHFDSILQRSAKLKWLGH